jgi:hypothetical protein
VAAVVLHLVGQGHQGGWGAPVKRCTHHWVPSLLLVVVVVAPASVMVALLCQSLLLRVYMVSGVLLLELLLLL